MRGKRILAEEDGIYHVISRITAKEMLITDGEKKLFHSLLMRAAVFSGVQVFTYAILDNHFHIMVFVPQRKKVTDGMLRERLAALYGKKRADALFHDWERRLARAKKAAVQRLKASPAERGDRYLCPGGGTITMQHEVRKTVLAIRDEKARYIKRMYSLGEFVKTFKGAYAKSYNERHDRIGVLWSDRYKSILLEANEKLLLSVGPYIDLNPVRAGIVSRAAEARWTAWGRALAGHRPEQDMLCRFIAFVRGTDSLSWKETRQYYHDVLIGLTGAREEWTEERRRTIERKVREGENLAPDEYLLCRVRYLSCGHALGSAAFIRALELRLPKSRRTAFNPLKGLSLEGLFTVRPLRGKDKVSLSRINPL